VATSNQLRVCWEKILETNPLFRITHPYLSGKLSEQVVAIHAVFASLDLVVIRSTDDQVARTKLEWWRFETQSANIKRSRHPVVGYLHESGAAAALDDGALSSLIDVTERQLEAKAPADLGEFYELCHDIYRPRIEIEASLAPSKRLSAERQRSMAIKGGLNLLFQREFKFNPRAEHELWWVPLSLLARNQMSRMDLIRQLGSKPTGSVFGKLISHCLSAVAGGGQDAVDTDDVLQSHIHLILQEYLHGRQIERMQQTMPSAYGEELKRLYIKDVFWVWKMARKIKSAGKP